MTGVASETWFIMVFYVLIPIIAIGLITVLVIYCVKKSKREK